MAYTNFNINIPLVTDDDFTPFLRWLVYKKGFSKDTIIHVVEKPHRYQKEYEEFNNEK